MNTILRDARTNEMPALKSALVALESVDVPDRNAAIAGLADHVKHLTALHDETAVSMAQPKAARRSGIAEEMFKAADDLIKFIDKLSTQLTLSTKLQDPYIDQLMELKQLAWMVRNAAGDAAVLSSFALQGRPQTTANVEDYIGKVSKVRATWAALRRILANGLPFAARLRANARQGQPRIFRLRLYRQRDEGDQGCAGRSTAGNDGRSVQTAIGMTRLTPLWRCRGSARCSTGQHALTNIRRAAQPHQTAFLLIGALALLVGAMLVVTKRVTRPLQKLSEAMRKLAGGDFDALLPGLERTDEIGAMANAVEQFKVLALEKRGARLMRRRSVSMPKPRQARAAAEQRQQAEAQAQAAEEQAKIVRLLADALVKMSEGDLTHRLGEGFTESYRQIKDDFNAMATRLQDTIGSIVVATREITNASAELSGSTSDLSQRTEEQAASLEQTSASMEEISATVRNNAENAPAGQQVGEQYPRGRRPRRPGGRQGGQRHGAHRGLLHAKSQTLSA